MCVSVSCRYGCAVRMDENDLIRWLKHVQSSHPESLSKFLDEEGIWDGQEPIPTKIPEHDRTIILSAV